MRTIRIAVLAGVGAAAAALAVWVAESARDAIVGGWPAMEAAIEDVRMLSTEEIRAILPDYDGLIPSDPGRAVTIVDRDGRILAELHSYPESSDLVAALLRKNAIDGPRCTIDVCCTRNDLRTRFRPELYEPGRRIGMGTRSFGPPSCIHDPVWCLDDRIALALIEDRYSVWIARSPTRQPGERKSLAAQEALLEVRGFLLLLHDLGRWRAPARPAPGPVPPFAIRTAIDDLGSHDATERREAEAALREYGARALPSLWRAARGSDPDVASAAERIIDGLEPGWPDLDPGEADRFLSEIVAGGVPEECIDAAHALARFDHPDSVLLLDRLGSHPRGEVRTAAALALSGHRDGTSLVALRRMAGAAPRGIVLFALARRGAPEGLRAAVADLDAGGPTITDPWPWMAVASYAARHAPPGELEALAARSSRDDVRRLLEAAGRLVRPR